MADNFVQSDVAAQADDVPFTQQHVDAPEADDTADDSTDAATTDDEGDAAQAPTAAPAVVVPSGPKPLPGTPGGPALPTGAAPAPTMDYRLFYLNNASKFQKANGQTDENRLNAAFFQTVHQAKARVENVPDAEFSKRLKEAGADLPEAQVKAALKQADKGYADYEKNRFNAFAGTLRNSGLNTAYNRRRGYVTVADNLDTRAGDETAKMMGMSPRNHSDAGNTATDQISQYYDQSKEALGDAAMPFKQNEVESQKARDFYQEGDKQVFVGATGEDGHSFVSDYTVAKPQLSPTDLVTSQVDPKTGMPRLVVWRNDSDANRIAGQAMNIQALLPKPAALTVGHVIGDLIPVAEPLLRGLGVSDANGESAWTGQNQTLNRLAGWAGNKLGYDPTRQDVETDGIGLGAGVAKGMAAVGAGNERLTAFEKGASKVTADLLGDYNFTIGTSGFQRLNAKQEKARLSGLQNESYRKAAQVQGNLNTDQAGSMFSSLPAFFYNFSQQVGQQAIQQGLNVVAPGAGFAYMASTSAEQGYGDARKAGLSDGASAALGGALGVLTYASEKAFDIGIAKYGRKLLTGGFEASLGAELGAVLKNERTALLESVSAEARKQGLKNLTAAQATTLAEKAASSFLKNVQQRFNDVIAAAEKKAVGQVSMAVVKEGAQEVVDQAAQTGAYTAARQLGFEDGSGKLKDDLAPWVKKGLADGSNPLAEKGWNQIMEDWYQAGIAGGLMGGVFGATAARGMAKHATLAQAAQASAAEHRDRQIATYLVENNFTPGAADELRKELKDWHTKHQLGVRTKVNGSPASENGSDSENTLVYQSLLNKVNVLSRLATDTNLKARLTPANSPALIEELAKYGNENVRTSQGLDTLYKVHEQQQDLQRLLEGKAVRERDSLTGEPAPLTDESDATMPGFDASKSFGMSPETYKLEADRRRAVIEAMQDDEPGAAATPGSAPGKSAQLKQLEEEAGRAQDSGALGVITRNRAVGAWYEASALVQQLEQELATTDGSDYQKRTAVRAQLQEARTQTDQLQKAMAQAVSQSADGSLSRVQQIAQAQLNLNALRTQSGDVFNGNLLKTHLQEGYLRYEHQQLDQQLTPEALAALPVYQQRALEYQRDFLQAAFTGQPDGGVQALNDYNARRKEFLAQRAEEQQSALATATASTTKVAVQVGALGEQATAVQIAPTPEGVAALTSTAAALVQTAQQFGVASEASAPVATALDNVAQHLETTARAASQDPVLRGPALQAILDEENQARKEAAIAAGENPDEVFVRHPGWVAEDPDNAADYDQKVSERLAQQAPPEVSAQLEQAAQLRDTAQKLRAVPKVALPEVDDEDTLETLWATHYTPAGGLVSAPGAVETMNPHDSATVTGIGGRISKLQQDLQPVEGESEAATAARLASLDTREVADLVAQSHYHLAQAKANLAIHNQLVAAGTLPVGTSTADLKALNPKTGASLIDLFENDYLPALDKISAALQSQAGSRYAEDDEHRSVYLTQRARQLDTYVAGSSVAGVDADKLKEARALLQQVQTLTATSRTAEALTQGTVLLNQAEELLRQAFATPAQRQALHQEVLDSIEVKLSSDDPRNGSNAALKNDLQKYRQGLSYRGESEDGVFMALQQLFGINRAQWSQHYAAVGRSMSAGTDRFGLPAPIASLEQEQAVLAINAFFGGGDQAQLFPAGSELARHFGTQADKLAAGDVNGVHAIPSMLTPTGAFVPRFLLYVTGFPGAGKCLAKGTPVLMHDFSIKKVEDVVEGDLLMGPDGKPRTAVGIARGQEMMYRVTQVNGMSYVVNESHILSLKKSGKTWLKGSLPGSARYKAASDEAVNISVLDYLKQNNAWKSRHKGWKPACMDFEYQHASLSPYFLGLWLGDGSSNGVDITSMDTEVVDFLRDYAKTEGFEVRVYDKDNGKCPRYAIVNPDGAATTNGRDCLRVRMKALNLLDNKHVPLAFLKNAEWMRLQLLAGLIDSDGHNAGTYYEITQTREGLANDIAMLARSLGFCARVNEKKTSLKSRNYIGKAYRVTISGDVERIPVRVERKKIAQGGKAKNLLLTGITVTPEKVDDYYGFTIDGDSLFLLGDFTVTHNTQMVAGSGLATLASLRGATKENPLRVLAVAPHEDQRNNLTKALGRNSDAVVPTSATVSELLSHLKSQSLNVDAVVLDEGTILSGDEGNQLFEHLETLNAARLAQGTPALKVLVLGDPAQLAGRNSGGGRQAVHLFVKQTEVIKFQLPTLRQIYRSGFVVLHQLQEELRNRILAPASAMNGKTPLNSDMSPVGQMAYSLGTPGQLNTLAGVQYQSADNQRKQVAEHIKQLEAARAADPTSADAKRTLRVIVSEGQVNEEVAALTALGIANAASYVTKSEPHGVLDVEKAQGQEFDFVYVHVNETNTDNKGKKTYDSTGTVRALNVAVSRAERYVSVRLSETDKHREPELNNQQTALQQFAPESAEARTGRTTQKLALLDAVATAAPKTGPVPTAGTSGSVSETPAATVADDEADNEAQAELEASIDAEDEAPASVTATPIPASAVAAVQAAVTVLEASNDTSVDTGSGSDVEPETEDDREESDGGNAGPNPAEQLADWVGNLDERAEDHLSELEAAGRTLRREVTQLKASGTDAVVVAQAQDVLDEVQARADQLDADLQKSKADAVLVPTELYASIPAGATQPGSEGGIEVTLSDDGLPAKVQVWKPEFDSDGQYTKLREVTMPASELQDSSGQLKSALAQLRSTRAWLDGQIRDLENKRVMLEKGSVARLAAENRVIVHGHVMEAVADEKARQQRLQSKNSFTSKLYKKLFGQQRIDKPTGVAYDGVLNVSQFRQVPLPTGNGVFQGNGTFYLVHHKTFAHGRVSDDTRRAADQNIFTIRYQEGQGADAHYLDVGVLRNNGHETLQPGELHAAGRSQYAASGLDALLKETAQRQAQQANPTDYALDERNSLGSQLKVENFKTPGFDRGLVSAQPLTLADKYARYEAQGLGASRPYVVTVNGGDNVALGDYRFNNKGNGSDTRASIAGGTVIFTSQGLSHDHVTTLVDDVLTKAKVAGWSNQRTVEHLLKEHNLEMDVQQELPLGFADYVSGVQQTAEFTFADGAALDKALTTQRGLDKQGRTVLVFKQADAEVRKAAWKENRNGWITKRSLFSMAQARPARFAQDANLAPAKGELHPAAYQTYGLLNKLTNVLLDSGIATLTKDASGKVLTLSPVAVQQLSITQAEHLQIILRAFSGWDRHLSNDADSNRSYETRYNQDLIRYLGYLDQYGALKGTVTKAWNDDTAGTGKAARRGKNEVQFRPTFAGKATGPFTRVADMAGLQVDKLLASRRDGMTDPSFVVNLAEQANKGVPALQAATTLGQNAQTVAQQGQQSSTAAGGNTQADPTITPEEAAPEIGGSSEVGIPDLDFNLNEQGLSLGDAAPEEFVAQVRAAFGNSVPWALDMIGSFKDILGAVVGEVLTVNRAANGLVDRRTIKHEMVHYALRIVDPAYAALVYKDAREKLMPAENVQPATIAAMSDKQVNEWLSRHYERVYRDYEKRGEVFKRRTKFIPDPILRLYRALRGIYDHFNSNTDYTQRLFGDLEAGLFRGRGVQSIYRGIPRSSDGAVDLNRVEFNRNAAGQRQHDFLELEKVFGSPQRRQQALHVITTLMQEQLNDYVPGKPFRGLTGALNMVRSALQASAAQTQQALDHPTESFVLDNHSANPAVATATRNYLLVQSFQQTASEEGGEKTARTMTTPLDVMVAYLYPHLKVNNKYDDAQDPYAQDGDEQISGSDGDQDSNGESGEAKANNINGRAYYLEDKNKAAKPGVELNLLLQTIPLFSKDVKTGRFQRDAGRRTVDFRTVNSTVRRAVSEARRTAAKNGQADISIEDLRQQLLNQFYGQQGRGSFATGNRRDAIASVYLKLFGGVGAVNPDGTFLSDAVPVQRHFVKLANGQQVASTPFSMYQVAYPERAGKQGIAAGLVDHTKPEVAAFALHYQRMLSQLLGHYTSTQRREYVSVDLTDGTRETKDTSPDNALNKRKNYNQQALLNTFYTLKKGEWQPSSKPLTALKEAGIAFSTAATTGVQAHESNKLAGVVLTYNNKPALHLGQYQQGAGQGFTATGVFDGALSDKNRVEVAHKLLTLAGLPFDKKQLTEMLGSTEEAGVTSFEGFERFLGELLARVWTSALGDSLQHGQNTNILTQLGATQPEVQSYLTGPLAMTSEYRPDFGNYDNLNAIDGQGFDKSKAPQYRLSPTAHWGQVLGLAQFQNDWVRADVRDFAYSADGQKIYLEQLGNGLYPRLATLNQQREAVNQLRLDNWQPSTPKTYLKGNVDGTDSEILAHFNEDLIGWNSGDYSNGVADGSFGVKPFQVNALTDARTNRKKSMVSATAKELHQLAVEHLFAKQLINSGGKIAQFFGAVISDKATQRVFELNQQKDAALLLPHGSEASHAALRNVYRSYSSVLRNQILPRYAAAGFVLSEKGQTSDVQALNEMALWLSAQPSLPKNLVKSIDHNGKMGVNAELQQVLTLGEESFVYTAENDAREDVRRMHADGYTYFPKALLDGLVKNKLLPALTPEEQQLFNSEPNSKGEVKSQKVRAMVDGKLVYHPMLLAYANSAYVHGHALQTALDGHHLNYKGAVDRAKRGIISATNFESYDVNTTRGLGATSKLLVVADLDFAPVAGSQIFGMLDGYGRFDVNELKNKETQDGQGYMSVLHALLEDESYGGKYMRLATPDEMEALGYARTDFPRRISDFGTRKNIHGDGHGPNGAALLVKDSKTILTNNYMALGNEKVYDLVSKMLGGYDSPLYQRWRVLHDSATPEQQAANADWYQLYDEFIEPANRALWEPHHFGIAAHPSAIKVGQAQKLKFGEEVKLGEVPHLVLDNRMSGKVLVLGQDPAGADISRITQEDHIISLLGDNFQAAQQVYGLLGALAESGLVNLEKLIAKNDGTEKFFMDRLQDLLLNLGTVSNTLSLVRAGANPNVPLLLQPLHSAISSSIKQYSTKLRNKGLRATVQSSTGLVQMYNVLDADGSTHRLTKRALVNQGYATIGQRGEIIPTAKLADFKATELDFMHLTENGTGRKLTFDQAKSVMQRRLQYEQMSPEEQAAFETELGSYTMRPMEMLIARDFVKAFNIPPDMDVADVNRAGEQWFIDQELQKPGVEVEQAQELGRQKWKNWQDILYVKGTRIPVTNLNSVQMGRVVGFHDGSQNVALVPSEMLLIAGADNDGDMITLEFLDLDRQGLRHQTKLDEAGNPLPHEKGIREEILTSKRGNVLLNPFNIDQLFKPIDFARFDKHVKNSTDRDGELREAGEQTGYQQFAGTLAEGTARPAENIGQWIVNQAGKSGVGPMVKAREAYNALHNYARTMGGQLAQFGQPSHWLGREVSSPLDNPREVSYLFEDFANAALDNAKENYLGNLNFSQETWGVYSALIMTRQNLDEIMALMTHPYAKRFVQEVQRLNTVDTSGKRESLTDLLVKRLISAVATFDEQGNRTDRTKNDKINPFPGYGYAAQEVFAGVQARQQQLHERHVAGEVNVYPDLSASVNSSGILTDEQRHQTEQYVLENLYLAAVRGDELLKAQGVLATMDGVQGNDYDNQRGLAKVMSALPLYEKDKLGQLERLLDATPEAQAAWAAKYHGSTTTVNAAALFANNRFVQSSVRAMLQDQSYKESLFLARQPVLQRSLATVVDAIKRRNGYDERAAHKLVMRGLDDYIAQDFLQTHRPDISLEAQTANPLLAQLATQDVSTVAGRTRFGQLATAYVQELQARERHNPQNPGVQDSPLVQELTITGGNFGQALSLNNATDLDPENKQVLESLFSELDTPAKYGVEGKALQQVLLYYNLTRNGLHLGKGSLAEVLSAQALQPVSEHVAKLAADWKAAGSVPWLPAFQQQLTSQHPTLTKELRAVKQLPEGVELDEEMGIAPDLTMRYFYSEPHLLPDSFSAGQFRVSAGMKPTQTVAQFPEFAHLKNEKSPGKVVLYRRTGPSDKPVWRRQYSALNPSVNNFGEYGYSNLPIFEKSDEVDFNADEFKSFLQNAQNKAKELGQLRQDGSFDLKATGNRTVAVDKELRCK